MKRVAIIGAGASGLPAIKCCLDERLEPTCYERTDHIGGLWYYTPEIHEGQACVMRSTIINTSKEMMCYSDFPIPDEYPIFMHNTMVVKYLDLYAESFKLKDKIKFKMEVLSVKPNDDFSTTGKWRLEVKDLYSGNVEHVLYDAVLICTGHHADKNLQKFPGQEKFKGKIVHSHDYKEPSGYENKRVIIVGIGNSGGDAAVELSKVCSKTFLSTRRGSWIVNRVGDRGMPIDMQLTRRIVNVGRSLVPQGIQDNLAHHKLNNRFDHAQYGLQPKHGFSQQHPTVNDDMPNRLAAGLLTIKPNIQRFTENGVYFEDGTYEDIDVVLMCTGYIFGFPFIGSDVIQVEKNNVKLYKYMFPPQLERQTLAVIGCFQPLGAIMPISELQCRLATRVFKGDVKLPDKTSMLMDMEMKKAAMKERYVESTRHTIQVDFIPFMDELALLAGCKPNLMKLFFTDFRLFKECFLGPCTPYQFRLHGTHPWQGARDAILTTWDRTYKPLQTRSLGFQPEKSNYTFFFVVVMILFLAIFIKFLI